MTVILCSVGAAVQGWDQTVSGQRTLRIILVINALA